MKKEYRVIKEKKHQFRIDTRVIFLGIKLSWKEKRGWCTFANDDGGWPESIRFKNKKSAHTFMKTSGIKKVGPFITTEYPNGTII